MSGELQTGILLFIVGMITVFFVLGIVILTGKLLILFVRKLGKSEFVIADDAKSRKVLTHVMDPKTVAVITGAVAAVTGGKALPVDIQKME